MTYGSRRVTVQSGWFKGDVDVPLACAQPNRHNHQTLNVCSYLVAQFPRNGPDIVPVLPSPPAGTEREE